MDDRILFLSVAECYARQSTCLRRNYGAVIVDPVRRVQVSAGFNGACKGLPHCTECLRIKLKIPHNSDYQKCLSVHAEQNALVQAEQSVRNCYVYIYGIDKEVQEVIQDPKPCFFCTKLMLNAGISKVITLTNIYDPNELYWEYINSF